MDAAWRAFGTRYWRLLVGVSLFGRMLPALGAAATVAAVVAGLVWLARHAQLPGSKPASAPDLPRAADMGPPEWTWWALTGLGVIAVTVAVRRITNPYRADLSTGTGRWVRRGTTVTAAAGLVLLAWIWKG